MTGCCTDKTCNEDTCMNLPDGKTCNDCVHASRCVGIYGANLEDKICSWFPRKFRLNEKEIKNENN